MRGTRWLDLADLPCAELLGHEFVHVRHPGPSNLIHNARRHQTARQALIQLVRQSFLPYKHADGEAGLATTSFIHVDGAARFWAQNTRFGLKEHNGICYTLELPATSSVRQLLVIFSGVPEADDMYEPGFSARYFRRDHRQLAKYLPPATAVLRIADLGGVLGAWYTNTIAQPDNQQRVAALITSTQHKLDIPVDRVLLHGESKGATAALLHSLTNGWKALCVDPILSETHYEQRYRDSLFTTGLFPVAMVKRFEDLLTSSAPISVADRVVITSPASAHFPAIQSCLASATGRDHVTTLILHDPSVMDHLDVGPTSLPVQLLLASSMLRFPALPASLLPALQETLLA